MPAYDEIVGSILRLLGAFCIAQTLVGCSAVNPDGGKLALAASAQSTAKQDVSYSYKPSVSGGSSQVTYSIVNRPAWTNFSSTTGALTGIPDTVGTASDIRIVGTDGLTSVTTAAFSIVVNGDPLKIFAWHLANIGQTAFATHAGTAGADLGLLNTIRQGTLGAGVRIAISDTGTEIRHEDLAGNVLNGESRNYLSPSSSPYLGDPTASASTADGDHGTSVAGLIAAVGWNGIGSRGVAPEAKFATFNYINDDVNQTTARSVDQLSGDFDVFNQSWGIDAEADGVLPQTYLDQLVYGVTQQPERTRHHLGSLYVKAAGNSFQPYSDAAWMTSDANADYFNATPYVLVAGALNAKGVHASYASIGSCLWVSGFGGEFGDKDPALVTTDQSGCAKGYSKTGETLNAFEKGNSENPNCNYTSTFNGTSAATPVISGAVALILSANPALGWRDVKHILASTATKVDANFAAVKNRSADPPGYVWDDGWITNAAGFKFHNYYGFGKVDVDAAVAMAKSYTPAAWGSGDFTKASASRTSLSVAIPDDSASGATSTASLSSALVAESVEVELSVTHTYVGDLAVELTSPSGTKSILLHMNNALASDKNLTKMKLLTHAFYGEAANGTWTLRVLDGNSGDTGTLTFWKVTVYGH